MAPQPTAITTINRQSMFTLKELDTDLIESLKRINAAYDDKMLSDEKRIEHDRIHLPLVEKALNDADSRTLLVYCMGGAFLPKSVLKNKLVEKAVQKRIKDVAEGKIDISKDKYFEALLLFDAESKRLTQNYLQNHTTNLENNTYISENRGRISSDDIKTHETQEQIILSPTAEKALEIYRNARENSNSNIQHSQTPQDEEIQTEIQKPTETQTLRGTTMENINYMHNPEFRDWLKVIGFDEKALQDQINNDDYGRLEDLIRRFEEKKYKEENDYMSFSQRTSDGNPGNELDTYYKEWCEKEHQPPYVYENTNEASPAYGMKYYKTPEDKAAGKPAARALYHDSKNVEVECTDDKGPDYEFLDALVRKAALDGQPGIKFDEEMTPEFANKLAAACIKYGMKMKGQPEKIDVSEFADQLTPEQKANIEKYNNGEKPYMDKYSQKVAIAKDFAAHGIKESDVGKYKDPAEQAVWTAANREAGITPKGGKPFYSMHDDKLRALPESARMQLKKHNAEGVAKLYESAKKLADIYKQSNPGKEFDLSTSQFKDPKSAALMYAAYTAAGVKVTGMDVVNKASHGMFQTETQGYMPDEARKIVTDYNDKINQTRRAEMTRDLKDTYAMARTSTDERDKLFVERYQERQMIEAARQRIRDAKANGKEANQADIDLIKNRGKVLEEFKKRQSQMGGR